MGAKYTQAQNKATQKYVKENYARLYVSCQKEEKEIFQKCADESGMSLNSFIIAAIKEKIQKMN